MKDRNAQLVKTQRTSVSGEPTTGGTCFTTVTAEAEGPEAGEAWHQRASEQGRREPAL